jgi:hypothetical protein
MRKLIAPLLLLLSAQAAADPVVGQGVIFRYDSTHIYPAVVTKVVNGNTVNLVALTAMNSVWYSGGPDGSVVPALAFGNVDRAADTDYRWIENPNVPVEGPQGPPGPGSAVSGTSTPTLTLNGSAAQFDATHDTIYTGIFSVSGTINLTTGFDGLVNLLCDTNTTPTTVIAGVGAVASGTVILGINMVTGGYYTMTARVAAGHRCRLTTTSAVGTPSYSIVNQHLQILAP